MPTPCAASMSRLVPSTSTPEGLRKKSLGSMKPRRAAARSCRVHDRLRASHRLRNALAGAKIAPNPLDRRIVTGRPGEDAPGSGP